MESDINEPLWSKQLETGVDILDKQHRRYLALLSNYLDKASESVSTPERVLHLAETFNFLRDYAREHFATEESIMEKIAYPDIESHREEHAYFLKHVGRLYEQMKVEGFSAELDREVNYYTAEWFIEHIRFTDVKFVEFINKRTSEDKTVPPFLKKLYRSLFGKG